MEAKRISQRAVKSIINSNTVLLHIGNFETGKRTNLRRAVDECVYTSRLYYNTEIYSDREKMNYLSLKHNDKLFEVKLYETHIAAINEYTEYHINYDVTSKYYTLVIGGMQFLIVSDMGWCNIYQVFDSVVDDLDKEPLLKEIKQSGIITEDQIQILKKRSNDLRRNVINYNWMDRVGNGYGIPLTEEQGAKELDWIRSFVEKNIYRAKDIEVIQNASPSDFVFKGFYNNGVGSWCNYLPIYEVNGIEYVPMSQPYIIGRYE